LSEFRIINQKSLSVNLSDGIASYERYSIKMASPTHKEIIIPVLVAFGHFVNEYPNTYSLSVIIYGSIHIASCCTFDRAW